MCTTTGKTRSMEYASLDPYEQQLLKVFESYDFENRGSLDREGLTQLCCTLQLEEQGIELVGHLLTDRNNSRVTFPEFKDALLALLKGGSQTDNQVCKDTDKGSPDREVSPKFVYGSKKYGRRSRPRNDEPVVLEELNENMNYTNKIVQNTTSVQRSNSQSDVLYSKKRKTATKLKRCTSFPGGQGFQRPSSGGDVFVTNGFNNDQEIVCTEEMLRKAWEKLGVGEDGHLNQTELVLVCDAIGLHRLAKGVIRQLSSKLELDVDRKISFHDLLEALQQDDAWSDVFSPTSTSQDDLNLSVTCLLDSTFDPKSVQHVTLGPDGTGYVNADAVSEMWESAGISAPKTLLRELGFACGQINVAELAAALEKEIKGLNETKSEFANPHVVLLQAVLALYRSEIRCLRNILEQMHAEREKLKGDVLEANNRATMLAQEVDDNHARMERNTQNQVRLLEQRHADLIKDVTQQFVNEKEQIHNLNQNLERKIVCLEAEEVKLQNDLSLAQEYSGTVEKENHLLSGQVSELQQAKETLAEQVSALENEKQSYELENQRAQIEPLLKKLSELQIENSQLRDKNDEMLTEIESLNGQVCVMRTRSSNLSLTAFHNNLEQSMEDNNISIVCEGVGLGSKRRNDDSPSKDLNVLGLGDGSPRLGKVRKCHNKTKSESLELPVTSSESGFDTELEAIDSSLSVSINDNEEISHLQAKIAHLEELLKQHSIPVPPNYFNGSSLDDTVSNDVKIVQLMKRCVELQNIIVTVQSDLSKMLSQKDLCGCETTNYTKNLNQKLLAFVYDNENHHHRHTLGISKNQNCTDASTETDNPDLDLEKRIEKYARANRELITKCGELENCIELLRTEYERCEDYWASKLDDERQMFEQEQNQSSEKLTELIGKMAEYEAQFAAQEEPDYRLPPIEEKYNLEKQFTDLEQEFEEFKEHAEFQLAEKVHEIVDLKEKLCELQPKCTAERGVQVTQAIECDHQTSLENKMSNLSNCMIESTNLFSADTMPFGWSTARPTLSEQNSLDSAIPNEPPVQRDYVNPAFVWNKANQDKASSSSSAHSLELSVQEIPMNIPWQNAQQQRTPNSSSTPQPFSIISLPSTSAESASTVTDNNTTPCRPKRSRRHDKNYHKMQRLNNRKDDSSERDSNMQNSHRSSPLRWKAADNSRVNNGEQVVSLPVGALHNLNGRLHHLEQRCRHLHVVLKQQHYHAEQMLQHHWQQHRGEKAELQYLLKNSQEKLEHQMRMYNEQLERLARTDVLVKDLYVENSYLVANVQRLEKQCHMLSQYNSASSSV